MSSRDHIVQLKQHMAESIIGQEQVIERLRFALLANGDLLLEGLPVLAKTRAVKSLARNLESEFRRIQFTPDLLPSDVTGTEVYYDEGGRGSFQFQPGPICSAGYTSAPAHAVPWPSTRSAALAPG